MKTKEPLKNKYLNNPPKRVLIILFGAIGDVVRGLSLATLLKQKWPECEISWAVEKGSSQLLLNHSAIERVLIFDRKKGFKSYFDFIREIRSHKYDITFDLSRHLKGGLTSLISGASMRLGFSKRNSREGNWLFQTHHIQDVPHFSDKINHYLSFAKFFGLSFGNDKIDFGLCPSEIEVADLEMKLNEIFQSQIGFFPPPERRVLFFVGSTWTSREWSSEHFSVLAQKLFETEGLVPIVVGSKGESKKFTEIKNALSENAQTNTSMGNISIGNTSTLTPLVDLCGKTSLLELRTLATRSRLAIGSDSGPMHIASILGLPVISLWGPTSPVRSTPYGNTDGILQSPIACAPCYFRECPGLDTFCLKNISPEIVLAKFEYLKRANRV